MTTTKFYVDTSGNYLGGFGDGAQPPQGAIEISTPPKHGLNQWNAQSKQWIAHTPELPVNDQMEAAFLSLLPAHLDKPYMTNNIIKDIMVTKQAIKDANELGLFDLSKSILAALKLPTEIQADMTTLMNMLPKQA